MASEEEELKSEPSASLASMISGLLSGEVAEEAFDEEDEDMGAFMKNLVSAAGEMKKERLDAEELMKAQLEDEEEEPSEEELLSPNKPFKGALKEPTHRRPHSSAKPEEEYALEYVYGYRSADARQNVRYTREGRVAYMAAAVGVVLDPASNTQQFFGGQAVAAGQHSGRQCHTDDILCLAISRDRSLVATGQVGSRPALIVWSCCTPTMAALLRHELPKGARGVATVALNADASRVACSDESDGHVVRVVDVASNTVLFARPSGSSKLYALAYSPLPKADLFVAAGLKTIKFYFPDKAAVGGYKESKGILGAPALNELSAFSSVCFTPEGHALVTSAKGSLLEFRERSCVKVAARLHKGAIYASCVDAAGVVFTGGRDGTVRASDGRVWEFGSPVRAVDAFQNKLVVGLRNGSIVEADGAGKGGGEQRQLMASHSDGELWGLECLPDGRCLTSGDDNQVKLWDLEARRCVGSGRVSAKAGPPRKAGAGASSLSALPPNQQSRAVAHNPRTGHVAVSDNAGGVSIRVSPAELDKVFLPALQPAPREWSQAARYSPCGRFLAVGSHDNFLYVYAVEQCYALHARLAGHSSFVVNFDWSRDSRFLRSNCGAHELLYFSLSLSLEGKGKGGAHLPDGASLTADVAWATHSCVLSWETEEVAPPYTDGTHVNTVALSHSGRLFASGDDWGLLCLHRNPIRHRKHHARCYRAHSEHVVRVVFSPDDQLILSAGGYDQTLMQWRRLKTP